MFDYYKLVKYLLEGLAVAVSAFIILGLKGRPDSGSIFLIALTAAAVFAILDNFSSDISDGARRGSGFGLGWNLIK